MKLKGNRQTPSARTMALYLLPFVLCLWLLAYQTPLRQTVHVGGDLELQRRRDDDPFLASVNGSEPADQVDDPTRPECQAAPPPAGAQCRLWWWELLERTGARPYRWTTAESTYHVPGAGPGLYTITVLAGGQPGGAASVWEAGPGLRYELTIPEGLPRRYSILATADAAGDLRLTMRTTPYPAQGDPRELGFVLYELRTRPASGPPYAPAWGQLGWLALSVLAVYVAALAAGAGVWGAAALAAAGALWAASILVTDRLALTLFTPLLALLASIGVAATLGGRLLERALTRRGVPAMGLAAMTALVVAAFALRTAGMLHPHALYSDTGLQANKLFEASLGRVYLSAGLPSDAGGGQAPYPPALFLTLMPFQLLIPEGREARVVLVQVGTALLDSLAVAAIWLMLRRAGAGGRAALLGAACYLLPVAALESFSVGELANLGGQALALPFITLLAVGTTAPPWSLIQLTVALTVALLAHSGVTLSVGALVAAAWGMALVAAMRGRQWPLGVGALTIAAAVALSLALLLYYSAPVYVEAVLARGGVGGAGSGGESAGAILSETVGAVLGLRPPARRGQIIPTLLGGSALAGLALLSITRRETHAAARLLAVLAAWWVGALITQGLLLVADQGVRWALFLYPGLCVSAGPLLARLWRRGRAGRAVAALTLGAIILYGLSAWIVQVRDYIHR